jgi:hypothetical protein
MKTDGRYVHIKLLKQAKINGVSQFLGVFVITNDFDMTIVIQIPIV